MPSHDEHKPAAGIEFYGGYQVYDENGIDLTLLRRNLTLLVENRLANIASSAALAHVLWEARRRLRHSPAAPQWSTVVIDVGGLFRRLETYHVEYVVIGGVAMVAHGSAHITLDLDVCYRRSAANLQATAAAFASVDAYLHENRAGSPFRIDVPTLQAGLNFTLATDLGPIDLLGEVSGVGGYDQTLAQSDEVEAFGLKVRLLSLDGLIAAKKAVDGRNNHLLELEALKKLRDAGPQGA